jgi:hypothetical protein
MSKHTQNFLQTVHWIKAIGVAAAVVAIATVIFFLIPQPQYKEGFRTLSELQEYAQTIDESIKMEGKNAYFPRYDNYYQKNFSPSLYKTIKAKLTYIASLLHLQPKPIFSPSFFKYILEKVTTARKQKGWTGDFIQKIEIKNSSKVVVFGATQGAFHSLVRYLEELKELDIIDEKLTIQNPDYYLIFLGNVVNRSPYTLEIFSIVLRLLEQNPENVIYLKGTNEFPNYWRQHTLRRELELRVSPLASSPTQMEQEIDNFFNTLPITLYCTIPFLSDQKLNYFKCAAFIENEKFFKLIDAPRYATFLKQKSPTRLSAFDLHNGSDNDPEAQNIISRALIRDIKKRISYEDMAGLKLLPPTKGVPTWTVLSTAAEPYRKAFKNYYEAFVIITPATTLQGWKITLYNRDTRKPDIKTFTSTPYNFFDIT